MEEKKKEDKIGEALLKVALGYQVAEVTEEYAEVDGKLKLTKRKKTKKGEGSFAYFTYIRLAHRQAARRQGTLAGTRGSVRRDCTHL